MRLLHDLLTYLSRKGEGFLLGGAEEEVTVVAEAADKEDVGVEDETKGEEEGVKFLLLTAVALVPEDPPTKFSLLLAFWREQE